MKQDFLTFVKALMERDPEYTETILTENVKFYLEILENEEVKEKSPITDNGKIILKFLQEHQETKAFKAKDIAEELVLSSRGVSGSLRKLVTDGFCEKIGKDPIFYSITEKGKKFEIE